MPKWLTSLFDISLDTAEAMAHWGGLLAIVGAILALVAGVATFWGSKVKEAAGDERLAKNELATAIANRDARFAQLDASKANERAAILEKETIQTKLAYEKLKEQVAWRALSPPQAGAIVQALHWKRFRVRLLYQANDPESTAYGLSIGAAFRVAGLQVEGGPSIEGRPMVGVYLSSGLGTEDDANSANFHAMSVALERAGITPIIGPSLPIITVYVGSKPAVGL